MRLVLFREGHLELAVLDLVELVVLEAHKVAVAVLEFLLQAALV